MAFGLYGEEKPKRSSISKSEWEAIKKSRGNKCILCGKTEKTVGGLEKAHIKAASKGGSQVFPMCPTCHKKFDKGLATDTQLKKVGLTRAQYKRMRPKPGPGKPSNRIPEVKIPRVKIPKIDLPEIGLPPKKKKRPSPRKKR